MTDKKQVGAWLQDAFELITCPALLAELERFWCARNFDPT
jgi:hypothetical protein